VSNYISLTKDGIQDRHRNSFFVFEVSIKCEKDTNNEEDDVEIFLQAILENASKQRKTNRRDQKRKLMIIFHAEENDDEESGCKQDKTQRKFEELVELLSFDFQVLLMDFTSRDFVKDLIEDFDIRALGAHLCCEMRCLF